VLDARGTMRMAVCSRKVLLLKLQYVHCKS
jgi:hypothetical protein